MGFESVEIWYCKSCDLLWNSVEMGENCWYCHKPGEFHKKAIVSPEGKFFPPNNV